MPDHAHVFLPPFRHDLQDVVSWSEENFGSAAADRYDLLIRQAMRDVQAEPRRQGTKARPDLSPNAYLYHLKFSRDRVPGATVKTPRHFILYRLIDGVVEFARLLHDSRDLVKHLPAEYRSKLRG